MKRLFIDMIYSRRKIFNLYFSFLTQMCYQFAGIMTAEMGQTDIKAGILISVDAALPVIFPSGLLFTGG